MSDPLSPYGYLLHDYVYELHERIESARKAAPEHEFNAGNAFGLEVALDLLKQMFVEFEIDEDVIGTSSIPKPLP